MFVGLGFFRLTREFFTRHNHRWKTNFDLCSALMAIEQLGFFSMPHLMWHGASVYNGHLRGPVTLASIAERLVWQWSCHYLFLRLRSVAAGIRTPNLLLLRPTLNCATAAVTNQLKVNFSVGESILHADVSKEILLHILKGGTHVQKHSFDGALKPHGTIIKH